MDNEMVVENHSKSGRIWKRVKSSTGSTRLKRYCVGDDVIGILYNTYAIEILGDNTVDNNGDEYVKVFSPDLNANGYVRTDCIS